MSGLRQLIPAMTFLISVFGCFAPFHMVHAEQGGTGFVINQEGYILTNHHVVGGCVSLTTEIEGQRLAITYLGSDIPNDLALLKVAQVPSALPVFRPRGDLRPGDSVMAVGFPLRGILAPEANVTTGTVSALAGPGNDKRFLQVSMPIQAGNSGGPVFDEFGQVTGVIFAKLDTLAIASATGDIPQNVNFAIKNNVIQHFLQSANVTVSYGLSSSKRHPADTGEDARKFTLFIDCLKPGMLETQFTHPVAPQTHVMSAQPQEQQYHPVSQPKPFQQVPANPVLAVAREVQIQIGAYSQLERTRRVVEDIQQSLGPLLQQSEVAIQPVETGFGKLYRARFTKLTPSQADQACQLLKSQQHPCHIIH